MSDRVYIGMASRGGVTARYLHNGDAPESLIPTLRAIWAGFGGDSRRMTDALLAEDWSYLTADRQHTSPYQIVTGVGVPSPGGTRPRPALLRLTGCIGADIGWLYVIDPATAVVAVYEATVHDRWLRHSEHYLPPARHDTAPGQPDEPDPRRVWRDDLDDAIRAYGDAREEGNGSADAFGVVDHLLDQVMSERDD
ncbi:hypothetical protein [Actinoplanes sp. G11-F43]|uniref:hypothetical protein n=1 Tax=Actinoplanes sp. G11-F43 TaxID=3424130 RepID=UPI003D33C590